MSHRARQRPFVIAACGEAAATVAEHVRRDGHTGTLVLVSPSAAMPPRPPRWFRDLRVDVLLRARVVRVDARRRVLTVLGHGELFFDRLVIDGAALEAAGADLPPRNGAVTVMDDPSGR